jgi:hypothetical protein
MIGFLYYVPTTKQTLNLSDMQAAGLGYAFDRDCVPRAVSNGPDGAGGVVCGTTSKGLGYFSDRQKWRKIPGSSAWVGMAKDDPPGPDELSREEQLGGHWVTLGDGNRWLCPVARGVAETDDSAGWYVALPSVLALSDSGEWVSGEVELRYRHLWELATAFWDAFSGANVEKGGISFDFQGLPDAAVTCLAANYRIGRAEAALLSLFDDKQAKAAAILQALIDWPSWDEILKKKAVAELSRSAAGPVDVSPATVQP